MRNHQHPHQIKKADSVSNIKAAFFLNLGFTVFELAGGFLTNSVAIFSDALHDLGDSFSLGLAWYLERYSQKGQDSRFSYGYRRFSLLGALVNAVILIVGSLIILSVAIPRILDPERAHAPGMIIIAIVGVIANGIGVACVSGTEKMNSQMVAWHLLEDVLGWIAVLIVGIALLFTDLYILDPILSILITAYVLYHTIGNLRKTLALFLQAVPEHLEISELENALLAIEGVRSTHHTHIWSLDGEKHILTTHLVIEDEAGREEVLRIKNAVRDSADVFKLQHVTVEIEYDREDCRMRELED